MNQKTGDFGDLLTLPADKMPTKAQCEAIENYCGAIRKSLKQTPEASEHWEKETIAIVTKLLLALPGARTSETGAEAKTEAYMAALDDVPSWAVAEAVRNWHRGSYPGEPMNGKVIPYDFSWAPAPAILRKLAMREAMRFELHARDVGKVLDIQPFDPSADGYCSKMRDRIRAAMPWVFNEKARA